MHRNSFPHIIFLCLTFSTILHAYWPECRNCKGNLTTMTSRKCAITMEAFVSILKSPLKYQILFLDQPERLLKSFSLYRLFENDFNVVFSIVAILGWWTWLNIGAYSCFDISVSNLTISDKRLSYTPSTINVNEKIWAILKKTFIWLSY